MNGFKSAFLPFHEKRRYLEKIGEELEHFGDHGELLELPSATEGTGTASVA